VKQLDRGAIVIGLLFIAAGALYLLEALDVMTLAPGVLWPILVIGFGVGVAFGGRPSPASDDDSPSDGSLIS